MNSPVKETRCSKTQRLTMKETGKKETTAPPHNSYMATYILLIRGAENTPLVTLTCDLTIVSVLGNYYLRVESPPGRKCIVTV